MMTEDKNMDRIFREKLGDFELSPPAFVWNNLQEKMAAGKRKKQLLVWRISSIAAALAIAFIAGWQINVSQSKLQIAKNTSTTHTEENVPQQTTTEMPQTEGPAVSAKTASNLFAENTNQPKTTLKRNTSESTNNLNEREKAPQLLETMKAVFSGSTETNISLAKIDKKSNPSSILSIEEQQIVEANKALLAMNESRGQQHKWVVGAAVSPTYSVNNAEHSTLYAQNMVKNDSKNSVNMGGGFSLELKTKKRWSVQSGVYYTPMGQSSSNNNSREMLASVPMNDSPQYFNTSVKTNNGTLELNGTAGIIKLNNIPSELQVEGSLDRETFAPKALVSNAEFDQNFEYLEVPLIVKYQLLDSQFGIQLMSGLSSHMLIGNSVYINQNGDRNRVGETLGMTKFTYSGLIGIGMSYSLGSNLFFNIEPRMKYYFQSLNDSPGVAYKPYSFGIYTGLSFAF